MASYSDAPENLLDQHYQQQGLQFRYPGFWQLEEFTSEQEQSATILTEETPFWMVSLIRNVEDVDQVLESALAAFEEEYPDLDIYERDDNLLPGWSRQELDFTYQDLISSVVLQAIACPGFVLLVMYQGHDQELDKFLPVFDAMTDSLLQN